jgi:hypothetical protein
MSKWLSLSALCVCLILWSAAASGRVTIHKASVGTWRSSDVAVTGGFAGSDYFSYFFNPATPPGTPETATSTFTPAQSGLYDLTWYSYVRQDYSATAQLLVHFMPGGHFATVRRQRRINSLDLSQSTEGLIRFSLNLATDTMANACDGVYLGRFELQAGQNYPVQLTSDGMTDAGFIVSGQVTWTGPAASNADLLYEDQDAAISEEFWAWEGSPANYYWRGHPTAEKIERACKVFALPAADRATSGTGTYQLTLREVYGGSGSPADQPTDLPVTINFEPGSAYTAPPLAGAVTGVDTSRAAQGEIVVRVNTQSAATIPLGRYLFDATQHYAVTLRDYPVTTTTIGTNLFVRKQNLQLSGFIPMSNSSSLLLSTSNDRVELSNAKQQLVWMKGNAEKRAITGKLGQAALFRGNPADRLRIPSINGLNAASRTIEAWIKVMPSNRYQVILARGAKTSAGHWELYANPDTGYLATYIPSLTPSVVNTNFNLCDNQWHFVVLRLQPGKLNLAVDGSVLVDQTVTGTLPSTSDDLFVGALPASESPNDFPISGLVDNLRLSTIYRAGVTTPTAALSADANTIGLYSFNSVTGNTFSDSSTANNAAQINANVFNLTVNVRRNGAWVPMFDAEQPIAQGSLFNLLPTDYEIVTDDTQEKSVRFTGTHHAFSFPWQLEATADAVHPWFKFQLKAQLPSSLSVGSIQPDMGFWTSTTNGPTINVDQGPLSIYRNIGVPFPIGFPAAYLWQGGKEALIYFNATPMTWMTNNGIARFRDTRVQTMERNGQLGLGLHAFQRTGNTIAAGNMVSEFYLAAADCPTQPTQFDGLERLVETFAPLFPADAPLPATLVAPYQSTWEVYTQQAIANLMLPTNCAEIAANWSDTPLTLVPSVATMVIHPTGPVADASTAGWDNSSVNNHLSPWILYSRLSSDSAARNMGIKKKDALPLFYEPNSKMIRWGTRVPYHIGALEMTWQNQFYYTEMARVVETLAPEDYNPAILGRFLMGTTGLITYAHNVDYLFSQFFDPYLKVAVTQNDVPSLGKVREPWFAGAYANNMLTAYDATYDPKYMDEARTSIRTLLDTMQYTMVNTAYPTPVTYNNAQEFPITELFGNAYGLIGAYRLYEKTSDRRYVDDSRKFLNSLLRLILWFDDESDAYSRDMNTVGLFLPHGGAYHSTPWESIEAHLSLAWLLKHDRTLPTRELLLKMLNVQRKNSFYYFATTFSPQLVARDPSVRNSDGLYFPIEPLYNGAEANGGSTGGKAGYMASVALWNHWMFDAVATTNDPSIMALNVDVMENFQESITCSERNLMLYNPTDELRSFLLQSKALAAGNYHLVIETQDGSAATTDYTSAQLISGVSLSLEGGKYVRVHLLNQNATTMNNTIRLARRAERRLAYAYQLMQEKATSSGTSDKLLALKVMFNQGMQAHQNADYAQALAKAEEIIKQMGGFIAQADHAWHSYQ